VSKRLVLGGGTLVTMDARATVREADLLVEDGRIAALGSGFEDAQRVDCRGRLVLPGFIQTHVHLAQASFRGLAEETDLLVWLERKIWPLEASHTPDSLAASARLGIEELVHSGTTTLCDMGSVVHPEAIAAVVRETGVRAIVSKLLMDAQEGAPAALLETPQAALAAARSLFEKYDASAGGRLRVALAPRFVLSCSRDLLGGVARLAAELDALVHTHLNESRREGEAVRARVGMGAVDYLDQLGLLNERLVAAHGVWLSEEELGLVARRGARITHCPSANLKLASGIADVRRLRDAGVLVGLGSDGLPCNNRADVFSEMRLAGLLSRHLRGAEALSSLDIVRLATSDGARVLGWEEEIGTLEVGKAADLVVLDASDVSGRVTPGADLYDALVYQYSAAQVRGVYVQGKELACSTRPTTPG
jgi:cytosine/adenosine deaminase-related metal-dependent hydrolase